MELIAFSTKESNWRRPRPGGISGDFLLDFESAYDGAEKASGYLDWLDMDGPFFKKAKATYDALMKDPTRMADARKKGWLIERSDAYWHAPVPRPGKLVCIGLNYRDHAAESKMAIPERPVVFSKFPSNVIGPGENVVLPAISTQVDYEAEFAVVIGRRTRNIPASRALEHVLGYTCVNDVTARDFQFGDGQWQRGKSCDTFAPMGSKIVTADVIGNPHRLSIKMILNGRTMQNSNTDQLIFGVDRLIEFISKTVTLEPGDVIATGTPAGVGFARKPPVFLKAGDQMEVVIEGIGALNNPVVAAG